MLASGSTQRAAVARAWRALVSSLGRRAQLTSVGAPTGQGPDRWLLLLFGGLVALVSAVLVRLSGPAMLDPDEHASVLYFERLIRLERLEAPLLSTPKPLLTVMYGIAWSFTQSWRTLTLLTLIAFAVGVVALARAAGRLVGPWGAVLMIITMVGWGPWLVRVAWGNSIIYAFSCLAVALDALSAPRRRWAVAGIALFLAMLVRSESWLLLPLLGIVGLVAWRRGERGAAWLAIAFLGPLVWLGHDWLLSGSPLYSASVPQRYTDLISGRHPVGGRAFAKTVFLRYRATPLLDALALLGLVRLIQRRALVWLGALAFLGPGMLALLAVYAWNGLYISFRYWDFPDLAVRVAAALGAAELARPMAGWLVRLVAPMLAGSLLVFSLWPLAPWDADRRAQISRGQLLSANAATAIRTLRLVARRPDAAVIAVPIAQQARMAVELRLPVTQVRAILPGARPASLDQVLAGTQAVFHDVNTNVPARTYAPLSVTTEARVGSVVVSPLLASPLQGIYVLAVRQANGP
jgi:hypothetical protein